MALQSGIVGQLAVNVDGDRFSVIDPDFFQLAVDFFLFRRRVVQPPSTVMASSSASSMATRFFSSEKSSFLLFFYRLSLDRSQHDALHEVPLHEGIYQQDRDDGLTMETVY